jgi:FAD/FMN-containing dehydrogenase
MAQQWANWSGSLRFTPAELLSPASEDELAGLVQQAAGSGRRIRLVGAAHSSSPLVETPELLVSLARLKGVVSVDREARQAWGRPGTTIEELGRALLEHGLAIPIDTGQPANAMASLIAFAE